MGFYDLYFPYRSIVFLKPSSKGISALNPNSFSALHISKSFLGCSLGFVVFQIISPLKPVNLVINPTKFDFYYHLAILHISSYHLPTFSFISLSGFQSRRFFTLSIHSKCTHPILLRSSLIHSTFESFAESQIRYTIL